jgi:5-methylcytosine-specific restriction protein B
MRNTFARIDNLISQINWLPPTVIVKWSVGQGNWARVPWVAFLDSRLTDTTQKGIYLVYLFREDMQGLYLALIQGVTDVVAQPGITQAEGRQLLRQRAELLRDNFRQLIEHGFHLDNNINLQSSSSLAINYQYGTIAYRYYSQEELPDDEALSKDLYQLLKFHF